MLGAVLLAAVEATVITIGVGAILRSYEPRWLLLAVALWAGLLAVVRRVRPVPSSGPHAVCRAVASGFRGLVWWQHLIVALAVLALVWRAILALMLPPFAYDALVYHLTVVADWVQGGRVGVNHYVDCCSHYPSGAEALYAWPTLFLGSDALADAGQVALAFLGAVAVVGLARWAGLPAASSTTAGALFLLTPIVLTQANTPYNDVALTAFLLTAAYFAARFLDARCFALGRGPESAPKLALAALAGSATGLALGTKTSGIVIACVLTLLVVTHLSLGVLRQRDLRRRAVAAATVFVAAALLVGGWWYARNWVDTGNPVWPFEVKAAGIRVFSGPTTIDDYLTVPPGGERAWPVEIARSWYHDLVFWTRSSYSYEQRDGGLGPLWSWLGWAALAVFAVAALRHRRDVALNLLAPLLILVVLLPYAWWSRFTIVLAALGAIAVAALLDRTPAGRARTSLAAAVLVLVLGGAVRATWELDPAGRGSSLTPVDVVGLAAHPFRERTVGTLFFREYAFLDDLPAVTSIAVERDAPSIRFLYPFFGGSLERRVTRLLPADERRLGAVLTRARAEVVVVGAGRAFDAWLEERPSRYRRISDRHGVRVYRAATTG